MLLLLPVRGLQVEDGALNKPEEIKSWARRTARAKFMDGEMALLILVV